MKSVVIFGGSGFIGQNIIRQHVVVLPSLAKPKQDFGPDKPLSICIFEEDMDDLSSRLESILIYRYVALYNNAPHMYFRTKNN